ncbi:VirB6/TrbL-like conjugal transfer protein, CD1112 family [Coprococcus eutactus]|uniref:VirB6/TrbL-like conjugal transfer protein, CD1112 family n=2 Tax=Lachnospiraceae TaxID=186803 RepID=UPI001A9A619A|nr:CD0415/CD1112 family protein [Coprococcus eutactus]
MNGFRDIFYELAYSNLSNMLSDLNEKVATISTELSTAPDAWQGGTIWELIVKIAEQVALPVAGTVFTFVVLWELISMLVQPNNLADIDFVSVLMKWLIKTIVAAWFISNALTICNCFFGIGASMVSKTTTVLNQQVTDNTQGSVLLKYLSDNYGDQDEDAESGDVSGLISLTVSTWFIDVIIKFMGILITIILYSRMISIYLHCAVAPLPMATVTNHHMSNIGIGYMKNVFALAMQAVLMMICVAIYGVLVANVFDPNTITLDPENGITAIKLLTKACWSTVGISILLVYTMFKCEGITKQIFAIS